MLDNLKTALISIWSSKARSFLNILGVIIGVSSVTILISLGEGLKKDVSGLIQGFGTNVITITSGKLDPNSNQANPADFISGEILTVDDVKTLTALDDIKSVSPVSPVSGTLKYGDKTASSTINGSYSNFADTLDLFSIDKGKMFSSNADQNVIVLGYSPARDLFGDADPIGQQILINKEAFTVIGTFKKTKSSALANSEFDSLTAIPFDTATRLNGNRVKIMRLFVKAQPEVDVADAKKLVHDTLLTNHDGEENFSVLTQDDLLGLLNTFVDLATAMVSAIAAISLIVGGIGIMNIMLVTVTERTREIGLRKAVGATKTAIMFQFLIEAIVVTFVGAALGLALAFAVDIVVANQTELKPTITPVIIFVAVGVSIGIGLIFGLWPALRAANKDPIEALRYE